MVNEYDKRQFELMLYKIGLYRQSALMLSELINDLSSLVDVLETVDDSCKEELKSWVWDLEEIYAVVLDRNQKSLDAEGSRIAESALKEIELIVKDKNTKTGARTRPGLGLLESSK